MSQETLYGDYQDVGGAKRAMKAEIKRDGKRFVEVQWESFEPTERLDAATEEDRKFLTAYIDSDPSGNGRRLGEVALVDAESRVGQSGRVYYDTLMDENAAAHIAFGAGFNGTRDGSKTGVNDSTIPLDVMIGSPDFEVTGVTAKGRRLPVIAGGLWQI